MAIEIPSKLSSQHHSPSNNTNGQHHSSSNNDEHEPLVATTSQSPARRQPTTTASAAVSSHIKHFVTLHKRILPILGLFLFYIGHDALQERMFRFVDFKYGFFMTLVEVIIMLIGSTLANSSHGTSNGGETPIHVVLFCNKNNSRRKKRNAHDTTTTQQQQQQQRIIPIKTLVQISIVGILLALAHGLGNTALQYSSYPLKVAFKSCKLVPTMALGKCVTGKTHTALQYIAALIMGMGLAVLTAADLFTTKKMRLQHSSIHNQESSLSSSSSSSLLGPILLGISTILDSAVPNLQEQLLQSAKVNTSELIFVSNAIMCLVLVVYTMYSGELIAAWNYCREHVDASVILIGQGLCAYFGLQSYLAIIRDHGGVAGVLFANARKVCTILLSFLLFSKPFNVRHFLGLILVFLGVYLGYIGKQQQKKNNMKGTQRKRKSKVDGKSHDHNV
jgi:drug/metabolite transporter (DMT)-like permease